MCLKTFGRFCADIEVVSASGMKVYEYIKYRRKYVVGDTERTKDVRYSLFYPLESLLLIKRLKRNACPEFVRNRNISPTRKLPILTNN